MAGHTHGGSSAPPHGTREDRDGLSFLEPRLGRVGPFWVLNCRTDRDAAPRAALGPLAVVFLRIAWVDEHVNDIAVVAWELDGKKPRLDAICRIRRTQPEPIARLQDL